MTSNPTIFAKAIGDGTQYDDLIKTMLDPDASAIYEVGDCGHSGGGGRLAVGL